MNFSYANELILREKNFEIAHGRPENTWYLFHNHVFGAAEVARAVADLAGMDANLAYFSALLHDIGKIREKHEQRFHGVLGYEMLKEENADVARACLVHTFPFNRLESFEHCRKMFFDRREDYETTPATIRPSTGTILTVNTWATWAAGTTIMSAMTLCPAVSASPTCCCRKIT